MNWEEIAVAAPAAFLLGVIVGYFIRGRYHWRKPIEVFGIEITGAWLAGVGAVLAGVGSFLSGLIAWKLGRQKQHEQERQARSADS